MGTELDRNILVYFENRFVPLREARVGILTHALHYGTGVFEGIRGYWDADQQELFLVRPRGHYARWRANCGILNIDLPLSTPELCELTVELVRRNRFQSNLYIRPLAYKSAERIGVHPDEQDAFAVVALPFGDYLDSRRGLHAGVASWRRVEDNAIPGRAKICGAYVNSALAGDEARRNGFDEAIFLTESGHVAEGAACNLFLVREGKLITPPVTENILEGITRASAMELARQELRLEVVERRVDRSELYVCDELFFTGTAVEIAPIVRVDHRPVGEARIGPVTAALRKLYADAMRGQLPAYRKWVLPVYHPAAAAQAA
ncbi:MAG: branched-chain amino acid transaminase [Acidobacteria bacterium]|nr:branched-chain amino acid transaminase [Acidobacteriota bacterium]